ncbi:P-type DNA transfer ATPase VirB11 [Pseudomonas corrugata]|uniref:P-type DNA transfer ATPase VirB11 n=1 Tax=Pseudomonas corrugata TaxID=47879 RepID=UPI0018E5E165|nr:P-type DNA transfer ATPase VirB11 [Pseudomonas corrugata]MBI6621571.1 P-type DNA transfer ATPase VirB11 [Pseudomonas corrugata]MBI6694194.1 P-type DNA transfer ATPase VirB11 [Pseudomonas corrugata]
MSGSASNIYEYDSSKPIRSLLNNSGIQELLDTEGVTEVAVNRPGEIWTEKNKIWMRHDKPNLTFQSCFELASLLATSVASNDNEIKNLICPVQLPDGQRGQIVMPPVSERNCISMTFRKPSHERFTIEDYESSGRFANYSLVSARTELRDFEKQMLQCMKNGDMVTFFKLAVLHKLNIIFGGATGSGKTTAIKMIADLYPASRRYITIEDVNEMTMPHHPNRVHLFFGKHMPAISVVESCMRMKGDHIFMSELKGDETWSYMGLLNTGHDGSLTTGHFSNCSSAWSRLTTLVKQSPVGMTLDHSYIYKTIQSTIDVVCMWEGSYLKEVYFDPEHKLRILNGDV